MSKNIQDLELDIPSLTLQLSQSLQSQDFWIVPGQEWEKGQFTTFEDPNRDERDTG